MGKKFSLFLFPSILVVFAFTNDLLAQSMLPTSTILSEKVDSVLRNTKPSSAVQTVAERAKQSGTLENIKQVLQSDSFKYNYSNTSVLIDSAFGDEGNNALPERAGASRQFGKVDKDTSGLSKTTSDLHTSPSVEKAIVAAPPAPDKVYVMNKPNSPRLYEPTESRNIIPKHKLIIPIAASYDGEDRKSKSATYKARLSALQTVISLDYNDIVENFIDMYVNEKRDQVSRMLSRTDLYYTVFEAALDRHGLPVELKYLPIIESALNPHTKAKNGASGLWQLPYEVAKRYGLECNNYIDERRDPLLSTEAAVLRLKDLYRQYMDWQLVIAAYHCGEGAMNKAIQQAGGVRSYWDISTFLPIEMQAYVPLYIAAVYVMNYYPKHYMEKSSVFHQYHLLDTVKVYKGISLRRIAQYVDMDLNQLQMLNPAVIKDTIPPAYGYPITLPVSKVGAMVAYMNNLNARKEIILDRTKDKQIKLPADNTWEERASAPQVEKKINSTKPPTPQPTATASNPISKGQPKVGVSASRTLVKYIAQYKVRRGDNMNTILQAFPGITAQEVRKANGMKSDKLWNGMLLKIPSPK